MKAIPAISAAKVNGANPFAPHIQNAAPADLPPEMPATPPVAPSTPRPFAPPPMESSAEAGAGAGANLRAALAMIGAVTLFSLNDASLKYVASSLTLSQAVLARGGFLMAMLVVLALAMRKPLVSPAMRDRGLALRCLFEVLATLFFLGGLTLLPFMTLTTLVFSSPLMLTVMAALFMGERVRAHRWTAVIVGFAGVAVVAEIWTASLSPALLLPLAAAACSVARDVLTRNLPARLETGHVVFASALAVTLTGAVGVVADPQPYPLWTLKWCALSGLFLGAAYWLIVTATRLGEVSLVAPLRYVAIPVAGALGWAVWSETPGANDFVGAGMIVVSGLYILYRERRVRAKR